MFTVETIPKQQIVYKRNIGAYGSENKVTMEKIKLWAKKQDLLDDNAIVYGIAHDDPSQVKEENCRYDVCLVVSDNYKVNEKEILTDVLQGGKYTVFELAHTEKAIKKAWSYMLPTLEKSKYTIDFSRPILERYIDVKIKNHVCEICIPII